MSASTYFKILFSDLNDSKKLSKEEIDVRVRDDFKRSGFYGLDDPETMEKRLKEVGVPCFVELTTKTERDYNGHKYEQYNQILDPLPVWFDTTTGHCYYEITSYDFLSDFRDLYEYYRLTGQGSGRDVVITTEESREMLKAIEYIFLGKYDRDYERIFLEDNRFISVLEDVYPPFSWRFRKQKTHCSEEDDGDSDYEDDGESEWIENGRITLERLKTVLEAYLHFINEYEHSDDYYEKKVDVKLVYSLSI